MPRSNSGSPSRPKSSGKARSNSAGSKKAGSMSRSNSNLSNLSAASGGSVAGKIAAQLENKNMEKPEKHPDHLNMMDYKGQKFEEDFGKVVRKLDREQASINEGQRVAHYNRRTKELWPKYETTIEKELAHGNDDSERERNRLTKHYEDVMEERVHKEWKSFGKTDRDWTKLKLIIFDEKGYPVVLKREDHRRYMQQKLKDKIEAALSLMTTTKKQLDRDYSTI